MIYSLDIGIAAVVVESAGMFYFHSLFHRSFALHIMHIMFWLLAIFHGYGSNKRVEDARIPKLKTVNESFTCGLVC